MPVNQLIYPVILSGGSGSRLWPLSRRGRPKQFLSFGTPEPMLAETIARVAGSGYAPPTLVCNADHRFLAAEALRDANVRPRRILLEPAGRNTAPAIAVAALSIQEDAGDPLVLAMPSDHVIRDADAFRAAVEAAAPAARAGRFVTFGITPSRPETGYGYIEQGEPLDGNGVLSIVRFHEKPDAETAERYAGSGRFSWNAGIFLFRASAVIDAFRQHAPEILKQARLALEKAKPDPDFVRLDPEAFEKTPSCPFDTAIMEKTGRGGVMPVEMGWSDLGSWRSLWEEAAKDGAGNARFGEAVFIDTTGSMAWSAEGTVTALVGVDDLVVIVSDDAVLVVDKTQAEKVKGLVDLLKSRGHDIH